ncbi:ATP-binding cassette domain-containing protein [uncultured Brevundimonas sp.]|uniref:ATP-binding cassette domain-containing protein n=1 Tax=uncultured Brevundimonas sp. TaxID=213418 RepID=UPI002639D601|nr:ATP-binding cassette domain-containing protein [uncultured Brevundimonas sp.]
MLPTDQLGDGQLRNAEIKGHYRLEGVRFTYDPELPVSMTVDRLEIQPGERIGIIGKIGAGKSTLLRLLAGASDPQAGSILLDNANIQAYAPFDLRQAIGPVLQDSALFFGTLKENIKLGSPAATDDEIKALLTELGSAKLLLSQPAGLNLVIREGGQGLSSGQRQAVLMARALLRKPRILILDEPTAPFDDVTERDFLQRLDKWLGDRTLIVSTHRSAVTDLVNRLIVVDQGRIILDGPKSEVIAALSKPAAQKGKEQGRVG